MMGATGHPQRVVLVGGSSEIGVATVRRLLGARRDVHVIVLGRPGGRRRATVSTLTAQAARVDEVDLEATARESHRRAVEAAFSHGDVDVVVMALGVLGDQERAWQDAAAAVDLAEVNYVAPVSLGVLVAERLRAQGHGRLVLMSSVAGERPRRSNFVYGSTKAGADAFYVGLGEAVRPHGVHVMVVRPGFVHTKLTAGLEPAPLSQRPEQVAEVVVAGLQAGRSVVWAPAPLRWVMSGLRHLPQPVFRKLPM